MGFNSGFKGLKALPEEI